MDNTPAHIEDVLAAALNKALRDLVSKGLNLLLWEGRKPRKFTVRDVGGVWAGEYDWQIGSRVTGVTQETAKDERLFNLYAEDHVKRFFSQIKFSHATAIFSAYPAFEVFRDTPYGWAEIRLRLCYLSIPTEIVAQLARSDEKIRSLDLDAPLTHRK